MTYRIYFEPVILCDTNWTLIDLKVELTHEIANFRIAEVEVQKYQDLGEQYKEVLGRQSSTSLVETINAEKMRLAIQERNAHLTKITGLETSIKKLDPFYHSVITATQYPRVGRSNWI